MDVKRDPVTKRERALDRQFVKGGATTVILSLLAESPMHGYELIQTIRERTRGIFEFGDGTIYPILYTLRERGLVRSERTTSAEGRMRKIYRVTPAGRATLERHLADWRLFSKGMALALGAR